MADGVTVSKAMSHALRHDPQRYGLVLDDKGWTSLDALRDGLSSAGLDVSLDDIRATVAGNDKARHEIDGERIRARYGHSVPTPVRLELAAPPTRLFHGTTREAARLIAVEGLRPMRRQYVHLSPSYDTAVRVGSRRTSDPIVLIVDAAVAHADGIGFRRGNDDTWLADPILPRYLTHPA